MAGRINYQRAKRRDRLRDALRAHPFDTTGQTPPRTASLRGGWRLTDGNNYPVTVTRVGSKETSNA